MTQKTNSITNEKPVLLELFSGTGSVGRAFRALGWEVFSVDIDAAAKPTLVANVLDLQLGALPLAFGQARLVPIIPVLGPRRRHRGTLKAPTLWFELF